MKLPERFSKRGRVKELVEIIDVAPTILDLLGMSSPEGIQGASLLPFLESGRVKAGFSAAFSEVDMKSATST